MVNRVAYSAETKWKCIEMKQAGCSTSKIMETLNIRNESQVHTWWRWYRQGQTHRFHQGVGKQYTYGKGLEELSELNQLKIELKRKEAELDVLKKYKELERSWYHKRS